VPQRKSGGPDIGLRVGGRGSGKKVGALELGAGEPKAITSTKGQAKWKPQRKKSVLGTNRGGELSGPIRVGREKPPAA